MIPPAFPGPDTRLNKVTPTYRPMGGMVFHIPVNPAVVSGVRPNKLVMRSRGTRFNMPTRIARCNRKRGISEEKNRPSILAANYQPLPELQANFSNRRFDLKRRLTNLIIQYCPIKLIEQFASILKTVVPYASDRRLGKLHGLQRL